VVLRLEFVGGVGAPTRPPRHSGTFLVGTWFDRLDFDRAMRPASHSTIAREIHSCASSVWTARYERYACAARSVPQSCRAPGDPKMDLVTCRVDLERTHEHVDGILESFQALEHEPVVHDGKLLEPFIGQLEVSDITDTLTHVRQRATEGIGEYQSLASIASPELAKPSQPCLVVLRGMLTAA
jgi:hypothetical protein